MDLAFKLIKLEESSEDMEQKQILYPKGIKWTKQRKDVYHVLLQATEPLSAVQIYHNILKDQEVNYAVSTIYRILAFFEENGYVEKSSFIGDGTIRYEWKKGGHTHYAICLGCHKKVALEACPFEHIHLDTDSGDFLVTGHKLELYGYCKDCKEAGIVDDSVKCSYFTKKSEKK